MNLLLNVKDLDIDSRKSVFFSLLTNYKYDVTSSTAHTFDAIQAYEINILTKKIKTYNRTVSCFSKPNKDSYYINVKL